MIVKNEENFIEDCLENAFQLVDNAVVVDTGSTDRTKEIIKKFGEKVTVIDYEWKNDFSDARNKSLKYADGDWILVLDADEKIVCSTEKLLEFLRHTKYDGLNIPLINILDENEYQNSFAYMRLFKNKGYKYYRAIHEQLDVDKSKLEYLSKGIIEIIHYGYNKENINKKDKIKRNLNILLGELEKNPQDSFINYHVASTYASNGEYGKALEFYIRSYELGLKCGFGDYYYILVKKMCQCIYLLGDYNLCIQFAKNILLDSKLNNFVDLYYIIAECYLKLKQYIEAKKYTEKCMEIGERNDYPTVVGRGSFLAQELLEEIFKKIGEKNENNTMYDSEK
jgi:glycosyltransferase involved in cell wall biosynthesis